MEDSKEETKLIERRQDFGIQVPKKRATNPKGNPNIGKIVSGGAKTDIGKLKGCIMAGLMKHGAYSKLLKKIRKCNVCPMKPKTEERLIRGEVIDITLPARCNFYKADNDCVIDPRDHIKKLKIYWHLGEKVDTMALQEAITYQMLEDSEMAREVEILETGRPGFYAYKHLESASRNVESVNKLKFGEKLTTNNTNVNVDLTQVIVDAYKKRKETEESEIEK